jgi:hypothetical protein
MASEPSNEPVFGGLESVRMVALGIRSARPAWSMRSVDAGYREVEPSTFGNASTDMLDPTTTAFQAQHSAKFKKSRVER